MINATTPRLLNIGLVIFFFNLLLSCDNNININTGQKSDEQSNHSTTETNGQQPSEMTNTSVETPLNTEDRINQIKQWYSEIQDAAKNEGMSNNCQESKWREKDVSEYFDQFSKHCHFQNEYELIQSKFGGWEWGEEITHYLKFGKVFFVLYSSESESSKSTFRIYYGQNSEVIRILENYEEYGSDAPSGNHEVTDQKEKADIMQFVNNNWRKAQNHLK
jgi:hypothetical protein